MLELQSHPDNNPEQAVERGDNFKAFLRDMGLDPSLETDLGCVTEEPFIKNGTAYCPSYFTKGDNELSGYWCNLTDEPTGYSIFAQDDYKRCICDSFGQGEQDCP